MTELVQLERRHEDFTKRNTRVIVVSLEGHDETHRTQADYPHLTVLSDEGQGLSKAAGLIHSHAAPDGSDTDFPTTILVDKHGIVLWLYRSSSVIARLSPEEVLQAIDLYLRG
jgi:peroxiredoxin